MNGRNDNEVRSRSQSKVEAAGAEAAVGDLRTSESQLGNLSQDNVNTEATIKYIQILEDKIKEYHKHLLGIQMEREAHTTRAIEELNHCEDDANLQERTKKKLKKEQAELSARIHSIQKNIQKLDFKLEDLKAKGIPKQVVPDDYVRQLKPKDPKKQRKGLTNAPSLPRSVNQTPVRPNKTASSGDLVSEARQHRPTLSGSPQRLKDKEPTDSAPLEAGGRDSAAFSDRITLSSSEAAPKKASLSDEEGSRLQLPAVGSSSRSARSHTHASRVSGTHSQEEAGRLAQVPLDELRQHYDQLLADQRNAFNSELDGLRARLQDESNDIHRLVDTQIRNLRYDQQELQAAVDENQKDLDTLKGVVTRLMSDMNKIGVVYQQIDDINNKITVMNRELQTPGCEHSRPGPNALGTQLLNLGVAMLSYGFVAVSCFINLLAWLLALLGSRLFALFCLLVFVSVPLVYSWPVLAAAFPRLRLLQQLLQQHHPLIYETLAGLADRLNVTGLTLR